MHFSLQAFLILLLLSCQKRNRKICFWKQLATQRKRTDRPISRKALLSSYLTPFTFVLSSGCKKSLVTRASLDHKTFRRLLDASAPLYYSSTPHSRHGLIKPLPVKKGKCERPSSLNASQNLGIVLAWTLSKKYGTVLSLVFWAAVNDCLLSLSLGQRLVLRCWCNEANSGVKISLEQETKKYRTAAEFRHSLLGDICKAGKGVGMYLKLAEDITVQEFFYDGRKRKHYLGNVLVFRSAELVVDCAVSFLGSIHDLETSEWIGVYDKLPRQFNEYGSRVVLGSASLSAQHLFFLKSVQDSLSASDAKWFGYTETKKSAH